MSKTALYFTIIVYYVVLAFMKGNVLYSKTEIKEARAFRISGIMFVVMTIVFSGVLVLIYKSNHYFEYAGLLIYAVAAFTFCKLSLGIYNIFKAKKHVQNIRNINLANALISIIMLQVAMFQAFSPSANYGIANALTGAGVSAIILALVILMIVKANRKIKELKNKEKINFTYKITYICLQCEKKKRTIMVRFLMLIIIYNIKDLNFIAYNQLEQILMALFRRNHVYHAKHVWWQRISFVYLMLNSKYLYLN